jgi:hypothetical protein
VFLVCTYLSVLSGKILLQRYDRVLTPGPSPKERGVATLMVSKSE